MPARRMKVWNVILGLAAYKDGRFIPCGSAILIGPSLALTATHVVDQPFDRRDFDSHLTDDTEFGMVAIQRIDNNEDALCWRVKVAYRYPVPANNEEDDRPIDISLIQLEPLPPLIPDLEDFRPWHAEINVAPPVVGAKIAAYGFTDTLLQEHFEPEAYLCTNRNIRAEGTVTNVFFPHRDRGFLPFPCFEVSCDFLPGMSGGPIFNDRDQVCGIVSSRGIPGISYGSILWPILGVQISGRYYWIWLVAGSSAPGITIALRYILPKIIGFQA
jgi:hypothetical protein